MLCACTVHDAVLSSQSSQDPCVLCPWDPQAERIPSVLLLKFCPPGINPEVMMECEVLHEQISCTVLPVLDYSDMCFREELRRSDHSSAGIPSNLNPASKEMISDSVELCETEFVSYTSN